MTATRAQPGRNASPRTARAINDRLALRLLQQEGPLTAAQLKELTGLSRPSVADLVERLQDSGLIEVVGETGADRRGPNARLYGIVADRAHVAGLDVRTDSVAVEVADLLGRTLARGRPAGRPPTPTRPAPSSTASPCWSARRREAGAARCTPSPSAPPAWSTRSPGELRATGGAARLARRPRRRGARAGSAYPCCWRTRSISPPSPNSASARPRERRHLRPALARPRRRRRRRARRPAAARRLGRRRGDRLPARPAHRAAALRHRAATAASTASPASRPSANWPARHGLSGARVRRGRGGRRGARGAAPDARAASSTSWPTGSRSAPRPSAPSSTPGCVVLAGEVGQAGGDDARRPGRGAARADLPAAHRGPRRRRRRRRRPARRAAHGAGRRRRTRCSPRGVTPAPAGVTPPSAGAPVRGSAAPRRGDLSRPRHPCRVRSRTAFLWACADHRRRAGLMREAECGGVSGHLAGG